MKIKTARQLWHDAYDTFEVTESLADKLNHFGVQFTARGAGNRVLDQVERGIVQNEIDKLLASDPIAYHWGMAAYTPPGFTTQVKSRIFLHKHMMAAFSEWEFKFPTNELAAQQLAMFCLHAECSRDVNGRRTDLRVARAIVGVDKAGWDKTWKLPYMRWYRMLEKLPPRALGPVAALIPRLRGIEKRYEEQE